MDTKETIKKLPSSFGETVMEFAKLSTDAYKNGSMQGQLKMLQELQIYIEGKIDEIQKQYDQTDIGSVIKKARDG